MDMSENPQTSYYWGDAIGAPVAFSVARGQGVVVNCAADLAFTTPGQVDTNDVSFTSVDQNNFTGNPFPKTIDIQSIAIDDAGAGTIGWGGEIFEVWQGAPSVVPGSGFFYYDPSMDMSETPKTTYYWGDAVGTPVSYAIEPNQGIVINCAADLTITIKN